MPGPERPILFPDVPQPLPPHQLDDFVPTTVREPVTAPRSARGEPAEHLVLPPEGQAITPAPRSETSSHPERERGERVQLTGRVGRAPVFRTTPKGQLLARFPLGVHPTPDTTEWKMILAFGQRAEQLRDTTPLAKGDQVEVIGYLHTRETMNRKGTRQTVAEVYAVAVRK